MAPVLAMTEAERESVADAVRRAEAQTAGEIVTILAESSDPYADVALAWSAAVALAALAALAVAPDFYLGLYDLLFADWGHQWSAGQILGLAACVAALKFGGMWLLMLWRPLRLFLAPGPVLDRRVHARALTCFRVGAERRTRGRTGILIYLSLAEHRAEIIADESIAAKVEGEVWGEALAAMLAELKQGRLSHGLIAAVDKVAAVLAAHVPRSAEDTNELPDRLIEV